MKCPKCGHEIMVGEEACKGCGAKLKWSTRLGTGPLDGKTPAPGGAWAFAPKAEAASGPWTCKACGTEMAAGAKFCTSCGAARTPRTLSGRSGTGGSGAAAPQAARKEFNQIKFDAVMTIISILVAIPVVLVVFNKVRNDMRKDSHHSREIRKMVKETGKEIGDIARKLPSELLGAAAQDALDALEKGERAEIEQMRSALGEPGVVEGLPVAPEAGESHRIVLPGGATMEVVWCPPGTFKMGSPAEEAGRNPDEAQHQVTLAKGFWMAKTEVTRDQWSSVMRTKPPTNGELDLPMGRASWKDCQKFCWKAGLRLPTEEEWEYACRAGTAGPYAGTGNLDEMGWYGGNREDMPDGRKGCHPVGEKTPNAWGLHDMHGNVAEWCEDHYRNYPGGPAVNGNMLMQHVCRGGSCFDPAKACRSASRARFSADSRGSVAGIDDIGFRPVVRQD